MRFLAATITVFALVGCASSINLKNAEAHAQAGYVAQSRGDWDASARQFAQAVVNADLGNAEAGPKGTVNYEYGRSMGVVCRFDDAQKYLLRAKEFQEKAGLAPFLPLFELALVSNHQRKYNHAMGYFQQLLPIVERERLVTTAPLGVAEVYSAMALTSEGLGKAGEAEALRAKASSIRAQNPNARPLGGGTPYGTRCGNAS
jgi:tetratricopeptide (TPR) repeat protein